MKGLTRIITKEDVEKANERLMSTSNDEIEPLRKSNSIPLSSEEISYYGTKACEILKGIY